jgi:hypothetical protein
VSREERRRAARDRFEQAIAQHPKGRRSPMLTLSNAGCRPGTRRAGGAGTAKQAKLAEPSKVEDGRLALADQDQHRDRVTALETALAARWRPRMRGSAAAAGRETRSGLNGRTSTPRGAHRGV